MQIGFFQASKSDESVLNDRKNSADTDQTNFIQT